MPTGRRSRSWRGDRRNRWDRQASWSGNRRFRRFWANRAGGSGHSGRGLRRRLICLKFRRGGGCLGRRLGGCRAGSRFRSAGGRQISGLSGHWIWLIQRLRRLQFQRRIFRSVFVIRLGQKCEQPQMIRLGLDSDPWIIDRISHICPFLLHFVVTDNCKAKGIDSLVLARQAVDADFQGEVCRRSAGNFFGVLRKRLNNKAP